jgi:hypothetical protein
MARDDVLKISELEAENAKLKDMLVVATMATDVLQASVDYLKNKITYYESPLPTMEGKRYTAVNDHRFTDQGVCVRCGEDAEEWDAGCVEQIVNELMAWENNEALWEDLVPGVVYPLQGEDTIEIGPAIEDSQYDTFVMAKYKKWRDAGLFLPKGWRIQRRKEWPPEPSQETVWRDAPEGIYEFPGGVKLDVGKRELVAMAYLNGERVNIALALDSTWRIQKREETHERQSDGKETNGSSGPSTETNGSAGSQG